MIINNFWWFFLVEWLVCFILSIKLTDYSKNRAKRKFKLTFCITMLLLGNILAGYGQLIVTICKGQIIDDIDMFVMSLICAFFGPFSIFVVIVCIYGAVDIYNDVIVKQQKIVILFVSITMSLLCFAWYNDNFEIISSETIENVEKRELLMVYDLPVQEISGTIRRKTGKIKTENKIPYWYFTSERKVVFDSAPVAETEIIFLEKCETPYLEIISHRNAREAKNRLNGKVCILEEEKTTKYKIYLKK